MRSSVACTLERPETHAPAFVAGVGQFESSGPCCQSAEYGVLRRSVLFESNVIRGGVEVLAVQMRVHSGQRY